MSKLNSAQIAIDETHTNYNNIHIKPSKTPVLVLSGSDNQGVVLSDAQFDITNISHRPMYFYLNQHSFLFYFMSVVAIFAIVILTIIVSFVCYQKRKQSRLRQQKQCQHLRQVNDNQQKIHTINRKILDDTINTSTQNCDYINNKHFLTREKLQQDDYQQKTKLLLNDTFNKTQIVEVQEDKEGEQEEEPNFSIDMTNNDITTLLEADETSTIRSCPDFYQSQTSINIYDQPPVHSISQWANDELLKYMKI